MWKAWRPIKKVNKNLKEYRVWFKNGYEHWVDETAKELQPLYLKEKWYVTVRDNTIKRLNSRIEYLQWLLTDKEDKSVCRAIYVLWWLLWIVGWYLLNIII